MNATPVQMDYEQAGELKIGQVGVANLRVRTLDVAQLTREMRERVERAPKLFGRAAVIIDFGGLAQTPDTGTAQALLDGLRGAGVIPVALAYGTREIEQLAVELEDLQTGLGTVEERARSELGMIRPDEIFVQISNPRP